MRIEVKIHAIETDGSDRAYYHLEGLFYRNGGNITQQGSTVSLTTIESDVAWDARFTLNTVDQLVEVEVNGNGDTVNWAAYVNYSIIETA